MVHKGKKKYLENENKTDNTDPGKVSKKAKIIVRNLPFKNLSEDKVVDFFKDYGEIEEVKLLRKDDGKFKGCGFVQFKRVQSAAKAIRHTNQKEFLGRQIVVDWALPKNTFLEKMQKLNEEFIDDGIKKEDLSDEKNIDIDYDIDKKPDAWYADSEDSDKSVDDSEDENEDDDEEDEEEDDDDDDEDSEEESTGYIKEEPGSKKDLKNIKLEKKPSEDVEEGRTVFVRNIPFSATNEDLKSCFESFGPVLYAVICIDKLTEHSKGTGFVKFKEKENAIECIKNSNQISLLDSPLTITMALSKENLENKKTNKKTVKDSRNLYLLREGVVIAGSKAAVGVSASDMAKRLQLEQWKNQILKNLNMFVSRTRLVIHNLPPSYDDPKLRNLFLKHSRPKAVIREAKVMYDKKKLDATGKYLSKEVGFVSFTDHEDALFALRNINNNPQIFTAKRRPIVAFSIENKSVINSKIKRLEKSRAKLDINFDPNDKLSKLNRKQRRFIRRREKFIERRREAKKLKQGTSTENQTNENKTEEKSNRKRKNTGDEKPNKKQKIQNSTEVPAEAIQNSFTGVIAESGKKTKLRSKFRLKNQASIHSQTLKEERRKKREKQNKKQMRIKLPKEKKRKPKLIDDASLSTLLKKHREDIQQSTLKKKWYDS